MDRKPTYEELEQRVGELKIAEVKLKKAEAALRTTREMLRLLSEQTLLSIVILQNGKVVYANNSYAKVTGYSLEEILEWQIEDTIKLIHPDYREFVIDQARKKMNGNKNGLVTNYQYKGIKKNGAEGWIDQFSQTVLYNGKPADMISMIEITDRKRAEEALRESEERYLALYNSPINLVFISDDRGNFIDANDTALDLLGYERSDIKVLNYFAILHPDQPIEPLVEAMDEMLRTGVQDKPLVIKLRTKAGEPIYIQSGGSLISGKKEIVGVARNITDRMQAEEALQKSEAQYRTLIESANSIILKFDLNGNIRYLNPFGLDFFKYQEKEILGKPAIGTIVPETETTAKNLVEMIKDIIKYPLRYKNNVNQNIKSDGERVWISWTNESIKDAQGNIAEILSIGNDLTERIKAEEALKKEKQRFQILVEKSPIGISLIRKDGRYAYLNPKFVQIFGYTLEDIPTGKEWFFKAFPNREYRHQVISTWISDKKEAKLGEARPRIFNVTCKDGSEKIVHFKPVTMALGDQFIIFEDITEQRRLEDQLRQAQKMEAIGTLAGGIAHDFNNILGAIIGYTELTLEDVAENEKARRRLEKVLQSGFRARDLVGQILTFSRQTKKERRTISVSPIIKEALKLLRATLPTTIQIHQHLETETDLIVGDSVQIHQVLMNLCTNAKHAMRKEGGTLELSLIEATLQSEESAALFHLDPGRFLKLTVSDTGHGIPHDITERIFDPYFTTKEKGEGTGLGLSVVHGIVKEHGGAIRVSSEVGKGTTFHIFLPLSEDQMEAPQKSEKPVLRGSENILLVDDEELLTEIYGQILETLGYQVVTKTSSTEALETFRMQPDSFDLVLTDYTMPDMTGIQFAEALLKLRPDIPVILYSGFAEGITQEMAKSKGIKEMLSKPLNTHNLSAVLRKCLG